jgi:hypothetical protein
VLQNIDQPSGSASELNDIQPAAIGNAIFDATGVRIRTLPFTPKRVLAYLKAAGKAHCRQEPKGVRAWRTINGKSLFALAHSLRGIMYVDR